MPDEKPEADVAFLQGIAPMVTETLKNFHPAEAIQSIQSHPMQIIEGMLMQQGGDGVIQAQPVEDAPGDTHTTPEAGPTDELVASAGAHPGSADHGPDAGHAPGHTTDHSSGQPSDHDAGQTDGDHAA